MIVRARDLDQYGMKTINRKSYPIKTMTIWGKGDTDTAKTTGTDEKGNLMFNYKTDSDGNKYLLFGDTIVALGSIYIDITRGTSKRSSFFSEDDIDTSDEWQ